MQRVFSTHIELQPLQEESSLRASGLGSGDAVYQNLSKSVAELAGVQECAVILQSSSIPGRPCPLAENVVCKINQCHEHQNNTKVVWSSSIKPEAFKYNFLRDIPDIEECLISEEVVSAAHMTVLNYLALSVPITCRAIFPIRTRNEELMGLLCLLHGEPITLSPDQLAAIRGIANVISSLDSPFQAIQIEPATTMSPDRFQTKRIHNALVENARNGMVLTDNHQPDNPIVFANRMFYEMTGFSEEEVIGRNCRFLQRGDTDQVGLKVLRQAILEGKECTVTLRNYTKSGELFLNELTLFPISDQEGKITHFMGAQRDVTVQRERESQELLTQKMESIGQLAAGIAHEINTPLQFVRDNTTFLNRSLASLTSIINLYRNHALEYSGNPEALRAIEAKVKSIEENNLLAEVPSAFQESLEGINRISEIVEGVKYFSHPGCHDFVETDLHQAIKATANLCRNEWKYVTDMTMDFAPGAPNVWCLPGDINQVILNLIVNAAHSISTQVDAGIIKKGLIHIKTSFEADKFSIAISDNGGGVPEELKSSIFEPFFTTKPVGKGTGQGLALAQLIVHKKHGGALTLASTKGNGATFTLTIPIHPKSSVNSEGVAA